ncbi:FAD/NAD(P)-binding oxidoreductase [Chitinimonas sp.]|uniref:FAD/NAD(P)-binding oxidoreductase n=1 Tax=Chitinimonas sp. TaxID=1934313 RepID=UPI002F92A83E
MKAEYCADVVVIGAGPAGMAAAIAADGQGADVLLIDDNPAPGGQIWRGGPDKAPLAAQPRFTALQQSQVWRWHGVRVVAAPVPGKLLLDDGAEGRVLRYGKLIIASGARERLLPFPGWTLPGVCGAGGLQAMVKQGLQVERQRVVLAGSGPLLLASAQTLRKAGAKVLLIAEQARLAQLAHFAWGLRRYPARLQQAAGLFHALRGVPYRSNSHVLAAQGQQRLESVRVRQGERVIELPCDWLGVGYGLVPNTELAAALGCQLQQGAVMVDAMQQTSVPGVYAAGEVTGIGGVDKAWLEGRLAGLAACGAELAAQAMLPERQQALRFSQLLAQHFALQAAITELPRHDTLVCRCEDVLHGRLQAYDNWREAKLQTRCGMGACQGRICGTACQVLYGWQAEPPRPPLQPTPIRHLLHPDISPNLTEASQP